MAAVLGLTAEIVQQVLEQADLKGTSIANYNSHTQIVISGPEDQIANAPSLFKKAGASLFIPLKVSGAFHSPHLQAAQQDFELFLNGFQFKAPSVPVIANVHARPYQADAIHASLAAQITSPVAWTATIEYLLSQGETEFSEIGPAAVLTGLLRRIRSGQ